MDKTPTTTIEFEIDGRMPYEDLRELIKKICEDHENKRDLRIKVKLV